MHNSHMELERIDHNARGRHGTREIRYPHIESVRIICKRNTPSAVVKIRRRQNAIGGPAVVRVYHVYSRRWLVRWLRVQRSLFRVDEEVGQAKPQHETSKVTSQTRANEVLQHFAAVQASPLSTA